MLVGLSLIFSYIYWYQNSEARRITAQLKPYEARVETVKPYGKSRYYSVVALNVNGESVLSRMDAKAGEVGATVTVWSRPQFAVSYADRMQLQNLASRSWLLFLIILPNVFVFLLMMFSTSGKKPDMKNQSRRSG